MVVLRVLVQLVRIDIFVFFFFQAEDGIRDKLVTGVQTCAAPGDVPIPTARAPPRRSPPQTRRGDEARAPGLPSARPQAKSAPDKEGNRNRRPGRHARAASPRRRRSADR